MTGRNIDDGDDVDGGTYQSDSDIESDYDCGFDLDASAVEGKDEKAVAAWNTPAASEFLKAPKLGSLPTIAPAARSSAIRNLQEMKDDMIKMSERALDNDDGTDDSDDDGDGDQNANQITSPSLSSS